ncbi:MAG TPA: hypothetical protein VEQ63_10325, partial [Bryobacteraceae bacterium]|nr:hypothetical protein [Bryobacteraceae bacterium]
MQSHYANKGNEQLFRFRGRAPKALFSRLPKLRGARIYVCYKPSLTAHRGKLLSKSPKGAAVYAGTFLRKRRIVLEEAMLRTPRVLERIFAHEVFHFVWSKLGAPLRNSFEQMIIAELGCRARGELGWSAESLKLKLTVRDREERTRLWKDYLCESFCDTAGWLFGSARRYSEMTLAKRFRDARRRWFRE